jgi:asparagine synthase (glutamine-hydrolysing)
MDHSLKSKDLMVAGGPQTAAGGIESILQRLDEAITESVKRIRDDGVMALSGGVDSALVACLAKRECLVVGVSGSHDLLRARQAASALGLTLHEALIDPAEIEGAIIEVLAAVPDKDPVNVSIATTLYFVSRWAGDHGHERIIAGQGADELFGGYSRYLSSRNLVLDMEKDLAELPGQLARDRAVAGLFDARFSLPYLDERVVAAARAIPFEIRIRDKVRKWPLRAVASRYIPAEIAWHKKKAMQYGSGVMKEIERLASRRGYRKALQDYLNEIEK